MCAGPEGLGPGLGGTVSMESREAEEGVSLGGEGQEHLKHCLLGRWLFLLLFTQTSSQLKPESHSGFYPLER